MLRSMDATSHVVSALGLTFEVPSGLVQDGLDEHLSAWQGLWLTRDVFRSRGRQSNVRTVGSDAQLQSVYDDLARGTSPIPGRGSYDGTWVRRPDGIEIGLRSADLGHSSR